MSGLVVDGWLMTRSALAVSRLLHGAGGPDALFLREKIGTAGFYAGQLLPQAAGLLPAVMAGAGPLFQIDLSRASLGYQQSASVSFVAGARSGPRPLC